ncbi:MAG: hypothetical protein AB4050_12455 [Synechococcus sp.]
MSSWVYRPLGIAARINLTTSHIHLKGVPLSWLVMAGMGLCVVWQGAEFIASAIAHSQPRQISIQDIKGSTLGAEALDYVTVQGHLFPESELRLGGAAYIPLIEEDTRRAILVRAGRATSDPLGPSPSAVTGRLQPLKPERQVDASRADLGQNVYLETAWSLVEGSRFNPAWRHGVAMGGIGGLLGIFAVALAKQGIIFEPSHQVMRSKGVSLTEGKQVDLHVSACLALSSTAAQDGNRSPKPIVRQMFVDMPGTIGSSENGELVLMANVDASSRGGLAVANRRAGWWTSAIASKSIHSLEAGYLHLGGERRPALRFSYREPTGDRRTAAVSFASSLQQQYAFNHFVHSTY